jgi:hypothetical protein
MGTFERRLPIKFVSFSKDYDLTNNVHLIALEGICQKQIEGVCKVWRNKAALDLTIKTTLEEATDVEPDFDKTAFYKCSKPEEHCSQEPCNPTIERSGYASTNHIEVYLVDKLVNRPGGGVSHECGQASAYCILEIGKAATKSYLLAHELVHVLGLDHPGITTPYPGIAEPYPGSWGSIAEAATAGQVAIPKNTFYNCRIFTAGPNNKPLNSIVETTTVSDCFHPDSVDHFISDFPGDSGIEPSVPPAGHNHYSNSNVWNRRVNNPGGTNAVGGPVHEEPYYTGFNYMFVKLEYRTDLRDPVYVDLYLADPGVSLGFEKLVPLEPTPQGSNILGHRLVFDPPPTPAAPSIQSLKWSWTKVQTANPGYPKSCCVFAIAHSWDEPLPWGDPTTVTFGDVWPLLGADNDIAQRNLEITNVPLGGGPSPSPLWSWLPWVQMANPFEEAATAHVEIDTTLAPDLVGLNLEVNGKDRGDIKIGESRSVNLHKALPTDERMILRLKATLPPSAPKGAVFPIGLRFFVDSQLITGYRHVVRVAPFSKVLVQVMDSLYGALRNVAVAFESDTAQGLAQDVRKMVFKAREMERPRGCWGMIQDFLRLKPWDWLADWGNLRERFSALAQELSMIPDGGPECRIVRQHLQDLADLLTPADVASPHLLIEQIRELADRIQEPAGRLARVRGRQVEPVGILRSE